MRVLHAEEVADQIPPERHGGHMEGEDQVQLKGRSHVCSGGSNSIQERMVVTCMRREGQGVEARVPRSIKSLIVWLVFEKHIHGDYRRCVRLSTHKSHFPTGFLN